MEFNNPLIDEMETSAEVVQLNADRQRRGEKTPINPSAHQLLGYDNESGRFKRNLNLNYLEPDTFPPGVKNRHIVWPCVVFHAACDVTKRY